MIADIDDIDEWGIYWKKLWKCIKYKYLLYSYTVAKIRL